MLFSLKFGCNKYHFRQGLVALAVIIDCIVGGGIFNFSATLFPQLKEETSPIKFTSNEETWFASILTLFGISGAILGSFLLDWIGEKWSYAAVALSNAITWSIFAIATETWHMFCARIIQGLMIGVSFPVCMCLICEVISYKYRGLFLSVINVGLSLGMLLVDIVGSYYPWKYSAVILACLALTYFVIFLYLSNTHSWYLKRKEWDNAKKAYFWYNSTNDENTKDYNHKIMEFELQNATTRSEFHRACRQREFLIPILITFFLFFAAGFSGGYAIALYSIDVMRKVVDFDEYLTTILIDIVRLLAAFLTTYAIKYLGIRTIVNWCLLVCVVSLLTLTGSLHWQKEWAGSKWITLFTILLYTVVFNIGLINMANVCSGELFTGITKPLGTGVAMMFNMGTNFIVALLMPDMFTYIGSEGTYLIFAGCVIIGGSVLYFILPETRNLTNEQIREHFHKQFRKG